MEENCAHARHLPVVMVTACLWLPELPALDVVRGLRSSPTKEGWVLEGFEGEPEVPLGRSLWLRKGTVRPQEFAFVTPSGNKKQNSWHLRSHLPELFG